MSFDKIKRLRPGKNLGKQHFLGKSDKIILYDCQYIMLKDVFF